MGWGAFKSGISPSQTDFLAAAFLMEAWGLRCRETSQGPSIVLMTWHARWNMLGSGVCCFWELSLLTGQANMRCGCRAVHLRFPAGYGSALSSCAFKRYMVILGEARQQADANPAGGEQGGNGEGDKRVGVM